MDTRTNSPDSDTRSLSLTPGTDRENFQRAQEGTAMYSREYCMLGSWIWPTGVGQREVAVGCSWFALFLISLS